MTAPAPPPEPGNPASRDATETTPLLTSNPASASPQAQNGDALGPVEAREEGDSAKEEDDDRPLPKMQLGLMCYTRMVDPLGFFCIFPFINQMIHETGIAEEDVGFWSGLIESTYSFVQCLVMIAYGRLSDRFGRRPVLISSLAGVTIALALFGVSRSVGEMIGYRAFAGFFAGAIVALRAMISEVSTQKTQARAFSLFAFSGNVTIFLGPLIGGLLSEPAKQYPNSVFAKIGFFKRFPYSLPCFVTAVFSFSAFIVSLFIKETLKKAPVGEGGKPAPAPMTTMQLIRAPGVAMVLLIYTYAVTMGLAFTAVLPVFWYTPAHLGGYGFTPAQISLFLALGGTCQAIWLLFVFPPLQRRIGTGNCLRVCSGIWLVTLPMYPMWNWFLRKGWMGAFWTGVPILSVLGSAGAMSFTAVQLALNDICPSPHLLGTLNALSLTFIAAARAVAPALFASLYAFGVSHHILGGQLIFVVLEGLAVGHAVLMWSLPEKAEGRPVTREGNGKARVGREEEGEEGRRR